MSESELSPQVQENIENMDLRGKELQTIEDMYLDGEYDLESIKRRIQMSKAIIGQHIYFMGRDLVMLKENCGHGEFIPNLNDMGISQSTAKRYMSVAIKFNSPKLQQLVGNLNNEKGLFSKLVDLSTETDEELESLIDGGTIAGLQLDDIDRMSPSEVRKALRKERDSAQADKEANDRLLAEKNAMADELSKKLAKAQGLPELERWKEQQAVFDREMSAFSLDAEELLNTVHSLILTVNIPCDGELQSHSARKSMALHAVNRVNVLADKLGKIQDDLFSEFSEFINEPIYQLSDPMSVHYEDQEDI